MHTSFPSHHDLEGKAIRDKRGGADNVHSWDIGLFGEVDAVSKSIMNKLLLERRKKSWAIAKKIPWMDGMPLTLDELSTVITDITKEDLKTRLDALVARTYLCVEKPKDLVKGKRVYKEDGLVGYNINKGKLSFPVSKVLDPRHCCPTLTATDACKLAVVTRSGVIRQLNPTELKRISGFPDDFDVQNVKMTELYDVFGNTICPPVMTAITKYALSCITAP